MKITIDIKYEDYKMFCNEPNMFTTSLHKAIRNGEPVIKSYWIKDWYHDLFCENCGCHLQDEQTYIPCNYCPNCGAEMTKTVEVEDEENSYELSKILSFRHEH